jgi:uncharacterized membrane protein YphA (DoxX/SURF4 family)
MACQWLERFCPQCFVQRVQQAFALAGWYQEVADFGLPWPYLLGTGTIAVQLAGGLAVISGMGAAYGAAMLAAFTVAATLLGHRVWPLHGDAAKRELTTSFEHLAIVGGLILVVFQSP